MTRSALTSVFLRMLIALFMGSCGACVPSFAGAWSFPFMPASLDTTSPPNGRASVPVGTKAAAAAVAIQRDGRIVTAGQASINGTNVIISTRMTREGRLDPSYGRGGVVVINPGTGAGMDSGAGLALQADGDILIAGTARSAHGTGPLSFAAVRLRPNGTLDRSFGEGGIATVPIGRFAIANAIAVAPDGRIVLAGTALLRHYTATTAELDPNGSPDRRFGDDGIATVPDSSVAWALVRLRDGRLILGGQARMLGAGVYMAARLRANGALDRTFGYGGVVEIPIGPFGPIGSNATSLAMALQRDGKVVLTGDATVLGVKLIATLRLEPNGALDTTFGVSGVASLMVGFGANGMAVDSGGRIFITGGSDSILALKPSGRVDTAFGNGGRIFDPFGKRDAANGIALERGDRHIVLAGGALTKGRLVLSVVKLNG